MHRKPEPELVHADGAIYILAPMQVYYSFTGVDGISDAAEFNTTYPTFSSILRLDEAQMAFTLGASTEITFGATMFDISYQDCLEMVKLCAIIEPATRASFQDPDLTTNFMCLDIEDILICEPGEFMMNIYT